MGVEWLWSTWNWYWRLGKSKSPSKVEPLENVKGIICRGQFVIALKEDGTFYSWGNNELKQLGIGNNRNQNLPQKVESLENERDKMWI